MHADVVQPLRDLLDTQHDAFESIVFEGKLMIQNLTQTD